MTTQEHTPAPRWTLVESPRAASIHVTGDPYQPPPGRAVVSVSGHRRSMGRGKPVNWLGVDPRVREDLQKIVDKLNMHDDLVKALTEARDALRKVATDRRAIGPIATLAQQQAHELSAMLTKAGAS